MRIKLYDNYLANLSENDRESICEYLQTSKEMIRQYYSGYSSLSAKRIQKIIQWAESNTPDNVPTFQELIAIKSKKEVA